MTFAGREQQTNHKYRSCDYSDLFHRRDFSGLDEIKDKAFLTETKLPHS